MTATLKRRQPNQKRAQKTLSNLLESAENLLVNEGFTNFTTRRLAEEAGTSVGVIYSYFPSIQDLLSVIYQARLNKRVQIFDELMMGENLQKPLKEAFPAYLARLQKERMWSRIDLELRLTTASDATFQALVSEFQDELTDRYCALLKARGSIRSKADLRRIALFTNAIDHASLRLQLDADKDGKALYGELNTRVDLMLMQQAGVLSCFSNCREKSMITIRSDF